MRGGAALPRACARRSLPLAERPLKLGQELATTEHYKAVAELVSEDDVAEEVICGPDAQRHLDAIREYEDAGFTHVFVHQIGHEQEGFLHFYASEILPNL